MLNITREHHPRTGRKLERKCEIQAAPYKGKLVLKLPQILHETGDEDSVDIGGGIVGDIVRDVNHVVQ